MTLTEKERRTAAFAAFWVMLGLVSWPVPGMHFFKYPCFETAALCGIWIFLCRWAEQSKAGLWGKRIFLAGVEIVLILLAAAECAVVRYGGEDWSALPADALIVLGAGVKHGEPSLALQTRLNAAEAYLKAHPDTPAVLTGGVGIGETVSEGSVMYRYLRERHPDWEARLWMEPHATSTAENYVYARALLQEHGVDTDTALLAVATNGFHQFRAKMIAERLGLRTAGIRAEGLPWWVSLDCYVREPFAVVKTVLFDWEAVIPDRSGEAREWTRS